ncbi:MAG: hypothetical protein FJ090_20875 [Deltaproteobacteria bacterium]|nr:hypothetical protein [Deltaproteobacteria bacterium]
MKKQLFGALAPILIASLACGGQETTTTTTPETTAPPAETTPPPAPEPAPAAALVAPWSTLGLPVGSGTVEEQTANHLLVTYSDPAMTPQTVTSDWQLALTKAGYTASETVDTGTADITAIVYKTTTTAMGLATGREDGVLFAYMEDITAGGDSVVRRGGRGARKGARAGAGGGGMGGGMGGGEGKAGKAGKAGRMGQQ